MKTKEEEEEEKEQKEVCTASGQSQKVLSIPEQTQINTVCLGCDNQESRDHLSCGWPCQLVLHTGVTQVRQRLNCVCRVP
jgi:hypothetical protein